MIVTEVELMTCWEGEGRNVHLACMSFPMAETNAVASMCRVIEANKQVIIGVSARTYRSIGLTPYESNFIPRVIKLD